MIRSLLFTSLILFFIDNAFSQDENWIFNELPKELLAPYPVVGDQQLNYPIDIESRSEVRTLLDTMKIFRQARDLFRQVNEVHYGYDDKFYINFKRYFSYYDSHGMLIPFHQVKSEYHPSGQLLRDTNYLNSLKDGIWLNNYSRQNKFDSAGNNVVSAFEEWSEITGNWSVTNIIDRFFANGLLMNEASRRNNGQGGSALTLESYTTWDYESPFGWTKNQYFLNFFQGIDLLAVFTREFDNHGNIKHIYLNDIDGPQTQHYLSEKYDLQYDNQNRLVHEIKSRSFPQWNVWQLRTRKNIEYHSNSRIHRISVELWDSIANRWHLQSYFENELDSYGNIILETHFKSSSILPDTYVLDKTVEYTFDYDYPPGSFVSNEDVDHTGYMLTKSVTVEFGDSVPVTTHKEYIYKVLQTNSLSNNYLESVHIFPNPFANYLQVNMDSGNISELILEMYNINGVLCLSKNVHQNEPVHVDKLIPGTYTVLLSDSRGKLLSSRKMIKK